MKNLLTIISLLSPLAVFAQGNRHPIPERNNILYELSIGEGRALNPKSIKILDWNLHKGANSDFAKDIETLSADKDILIFQEMLLDKKMTDIFLGMKGIGFETATSFFYPTNRARTGVASGSRVTSIETTAVRTEVLEPAIKKPKVTIITRYPIAGTNKILTIANIHSVNFVSSEDFKLELDRVYNVLKQYPKPIIFSGDFNTWLDKKISYLDQIRKALDLDEAKFSPDQRLLFKNHPLDHFLFSKDLHIVSAKVEGHYMGSDHKPMEIELEYSPQD